MALLSMVGVAHATDPGDGGCGITVSKVSWPTGGLAGNIHYLSIKFATTCGLSFRAEYHGNDFHTAHFMRTGTP